MLMSMGELHTLGLGRNQLTSIPPNLGKMIELRELDLFMNKLRILTLSEPVPKLHSLLLRANRIAELSDSLLNLSALTYLDVSNNKIESLLPLAQLPCLKKLECSSCKIINLNVFSMRDSPLCQSISVLNVSCNRQITSVVDLQTPNLTEMRAMNCSIDRVASKLTMCTKLKVLDLDGNPLRHVSLESPKLEVLAICGSKLHQFPVLDAGNLIEIASANTQLRRMPERADAATVNLRRLYLQRNNIAEIGSSYLESLTVSEPPFDSYSFLLFFELFEKTTIISVFKSFLFVSTAFGTSRDSVFRTV